MKLKKYMVFITIVICVAVYSFIWYIPDAGTNISLGQITGTGQNARQTGMGDQQVSNLPAAIEEGTLQLPVIIISENYLLYGENRYSSAEPAASPFNNRPVFNSYYADLDCDGVYEAYATVSMGSGIVTSYLLGYDLVTENSYMRNERMDMNYSFCMFHYELFVAAWPYGKGKEEAVRYYRPQLDQDRFTFELEPVDEVLEADISAFFAAQKGAEEEEAARIMRFGYAVREERVDREVPLHEDDFKQLWEGQKLQSMQNEYSMYLSSAQPPGVVEKMGMYDGQIIYSMSRHQESRKLVPFHSNPYYIIDENTYVVLFFVDEFFFPPFSRLEHIEVWDAEGNKLREIELE